MNFQDQLNEIRKRAGILREQLEDPESEGWMEKERDEATVDPTRRYVQQLSDMLKRIHELCHVGMRLSEKDSVRSVFRDIMDTLGVKESVIRTRIPNTFEEQLEEIQRLAGLKEGDVVAFDPSRRKQPEPEVDTNKASEVARLKEQLAELTGAQKDIVQELADVIAERARLAVRVHILNTGADPRDAMIKMINDPRFKTTQINPVTAEIESKVLLDLGMQHPTPLDHTDD